MAYSVDFRKKVIEYLKKGHSQREAGQAFGINVGTVNKWNQRNQKGGELKDAAPRRRFRKLDPEKLKAYVCEHPDAYLKEIGEAFGCSEAAVRKAFKRMNITRKKNKTLSRTKP